MTSPPYTLSNLPDLTYLEECWGDINDITGSNLPCPWTGKLPRKVVEVSPASSSSTLVGKKRDHSAVIDTPLSCTSTAAPTPSSSRPTKKLKASAQAPPPTPTPTPPTAADFVGHRLPGQPALKLQPTPAVLEYRETMIRYRAQQEAAKKVKQEAFGK